jgi:hypothetical protein
MRLKRLFANRDERWFYSIAILAVGLLAYSTVLIVGIPSKLSLILFANDSTFLFIAIVGLLYLAYRPSGRIGTLTSFNATLILFALQLSGVWRSVKSGSFAIGGLLPMSDASNYYLGARRLLEGGDLSVIASWRPLFSGMLATLLGLTQQNLQLTLAILVLINAIACFFLAREIQKSHGTVSGILLLTLLFLFYRNYIGLAMTENLGLALGTVGLAILWRGTINKQINLCLFGIFVLTLALNARAGAFFILPALILWGAWCFRGSSRFSVRFLVSGVGVVLLGFILNSIVFKAIGSPNTSANSNFSYTLYGLLVGGRWDTVFTDYPQLRTLGDIERAKKVYELALETFRAAPLNLVSGLLRAWKQFFFDNFIFSFVKSTQVNLTLQLLGFIALANCYRQRQSPIASLFLAMTAGIFFSVPFVPPWDAGIRPYAATIPVFSGFPALGLTFIAQKMEWHKLIQIPPQKSSSRVLLIFSFGLILLSVGSPIATKMLSYPSQLGDLSCRVGTKLIYVRNSAGSSINLVADDAIKRSYVPNLRIGDFRSGLDSLLKSSNFSRSEIAKELAMVPPNSTLTNQIDLKNDAIVWTIADTNIMPKRSGIVGVCGTPTTNIATKNHGVFLFYADSMTLISH